MMAAKLLKHTPESAQTAFYRKSEEFFEYVIAGYGTGVRFVLRHQVLTLLVTLATFVLTVYLYIIVPKGFFPVQDTGVLLGITEAPQAVSFTEMADRQQKLANIILQDPDVESLSSFIGIDGTNTTINSGRIQINLKDRESRSISAADVIRRLQPRVSQVEGMQCFLQPLQDLTVEDRVSRTQYQYSMEDASPTELALWADRMVAELRKHSDVLTDVASDQQLGGLEANVVIDRDTASPASASPRRTSTTPSTTPSASARSRPSSPSSTSTTSSWRSRRAFSAAPPRSRTSTSKAPTEPRFRSPPSPTSSSRPPPSPSTIRASSRP